MSLHHCICSYIKTWLFSLLTHNISVLTERTFGCGLNTTVATNVERQIHVSRYA